MLPVVSSLAHFNFSPLYLTVALEIHRIAQHSHGEKKEENTENEHRYKAHQPVPGRVCDRGIAGRRGWRGSGGD
jgi:hypothetical protein